MNEYKQKLIKSLSKKEIGVLFFAVCDLTNDEIAAETDYSASNVGTILTRIFKHFEKFGVTIEGDGIEKEDLIIEFQQDVFELIKSEDDMKKWVRIVPTETDELYILSMRSSDVMFRKVLNMGQDSPVEPEVQAYINLVYTMPDHGDPEHDGTAGMTEEERCQRYQEMDDEFRRNSGFFKNYPDLYNEIKNKSGRRSSNTTS